MSTRARSPGTAAARTPTRGAEVPAMGDAAGASIIIVSLDGRGRLAMPLDALAACDPPPAEVLVVDNGSKDGTAEFVRGRYPWARVVRAPRNLGFAGGNNLGILNARGSILVLLNDDTEPDAGFLAPLLDAFHADPRLGAAGVRLAYPNGGAIQHLGGSVEANGLTRHAGWGDADADPAGGPVEVEYATGACLALRREAVSGVGLLDEGFWPIYFEEVDYCRRLREAGWRIAVVPSSRVVHHESQTTGRMSAGFLEKYHRNRLRHLLKSARTTRQRLRAIRAEARWIVGNHPWDAFWPCAKAYAWAALQWREAARAVEAERPRRMRRRAAP